MMALMRKPLALPRRDWVPMIVLSLIGVALFQACWGLAMARTAPSSGLDRHDHHDRLLRHPGLARRPAAAGLGWAGIVIAFAGVVLVVNNSLSAFTISIGSLDGTLIWMLSAFAWALYVDRGAPYNLPARRPAGHGLDDPDRLAGPAADLAAFDSLGEFARLDDRLLGYWLYTAIFPVGVAFLGLTAGLDRLGVSRVMVYMYLIPVAGVGLSAAFFGDPLTAARVLGGLIVLLGVILTRVALDRAARLPV